MDREILSAPQTLLLFGACCVLVAMRAPSAVFATNLLYEDATVYFNYYYGGHRAFTDIFRHYSGYISLWSQFAAWLAASFPLPIHLALYSILPLGMTAASCAAIAASGVLRSRAMAVLFAIALAGTPFNSGLYQLNITNSQWPALLVFYSIASRLLILSPVRWERYPLAVTAGVFAWTHPYSVLLIPVIAVRIVRGSRSDWGSLGICLLSLLAYLGTFSTGQSHLGNLLNVRILSSMIYSTFSDVLCFQVTKSLVPGIWVLLAIAVIGFVSARRRMLYRPDGVDITVLWLWTGSWLIYALSPKAPQGFSEPQFRYFYIQQVLFLLLLAKCGERQLRWPTKLVRSQVFAAAAVTALVVASALFLHTLPGFEFKPNRSRQETLRRIERAELHQERPDTEPLILSDDDRQFQLRAVIRGR